jgi:hypothetical protein
MQIWMALLYKGIPFDVVFIDLRNKPDWYEGIVPTKLVPAVRLRDSGEVVYESADILKARHGCLTKPCAEVRMPQRKAEPLLQSLPQYSYVAQ